jgi:UDP-N-acetylmuramoylalanine-D-glutamate ligase/very-short-patch-repair endonuclease
MSTFPPDVFRGSRFAGLGLGRNGLAVARALLAMGAEVTAWDDTPAARATAGGVPLRDPCEGDFSPDALVLSPGIPHLLPRPHSAAVRARAAGVPILSDAELLFQAVRRTGSQARFVGITGTNGKSTTTALLAHILECAGTPVAAGGNLGTAALALPLLPDDGVYVLEMSSYMLERLATLRFDAAAMLNLSPDHLDRHGDMAGYIAAKRAIFDRQATGDLAVVGVDDADSRAMAAWLRARPAQVVTISGQTDEAGARNAKRSPPPLVGGGRGEGSVQPPPPQTSLVPYARRMRRDPTPAERKLWQALRKRQAAGLKFRRQTPLGPFIVDLYCSSSRLVVELDGISHIDSQIDPARDAWMQSQGIRILRYSNHEVLSNCEGVCLAIEQIARSTPPPNPLPQGEGESSSSSPLPHSLAHILADAPALPGTHNAQNAAAAYAIARFLGVPHDTIAHAMTTFPGLPHRQQRLRTIDGVTFINDSKATNADAAACALSCYDRVVWIAGGLAKEGGIEPLASFFPRIARALLIGRDAPMLSATLTEHDVPHEIAGTLEAATSRAFTAARASGVPVVLLSPACASFDQFSGFDARGEKFAGLVASLAQERAA